MTPSPRRRFPALPLATSAVLLAASPPSAAALDSLAPFAGRPVVAVLLQGNETTRENVVRREIQTAVGEPLRPEVVEQDVLRLDNLSIFAQVAVEAEPVGEGVRLVYRLKEMPAWIPWVGFSYTEQDGFSGGPKLSALNLKGQAISLSARAYFGGAKQYSANLSWPWIKGNHVSFEFAGARLSRTDTLNEFKETSYEFTPGAGRYLGRNGRLEAKFSLFRMGSDVDGKTLDPDNQDVLPRLGASVGWDTRDSWRFPRKGWLNELELWYTSGDGDFVSVNLDLRRWLPVGERQRFLLSSLISLQSGTVGVDTPQYLLYRLGGANSIRGYSIDDLGRRLFGKNQLLGTVEYSANVLRLQRWDFWKFALRMGLDFAVFADAGIAWSDSSELALDRARGGLGAGLRLLVPGS
ncbi:MAG TPA: BamA/TamA family outer membrane protein, partial [Vicinamibacteria bacterium]